MKENAKGTFSIRNWEEYQHYKDRNPPWVKLHVKVLDDPDFQALSIPAKALALLLLAVAARKNNVIPASTAWLSVEVHMPARVLARALAELLAISFLICTESASKNAMPRDRDREQSVNSSNVYLIPETALAKLLTALVDQDDNTERTLRSMALKHRLTEGDFMWARECAMGPGVNSPVRVATAELKKRVALRTERAA